MKKYLIVLYVCLSIGGCSNRLELSPKELFVVHIDEQLTIEQQRDRLRYGRLLKPEVEGDSLRLPLVQDVPQEYVNYVTAFVRLVNGYFLQLEENEKKIILENFREWTIDDAVIGSWVHKVNGRYDLKMNRENALKIGIAREKYDQVEGNVKQVNDLIRSGEKTGIVENEVLYPAVSIFFNHGIFVMMKEPNLDKTFMKDLESLVF